RNRRAGKEIRRESPEIKHAQHIWRSSVDSGNASLLRDCRIASRWLYSGYQRQVGIRDTIDRGRERGESASESEVNRRAAWPWIVHFYLCRDTLTAGLLHSP